MAGFFFCLASAEGAGLFFCPAKIQPNTSVYSAFCSVHASYTTHATKQHTGLYRGVSVNLTHSNAANTRPTQAAIIPPVPLWSVSQRRNASNVYQILAPLRTLYRSAQPPIIIRYIRARPVMDPCQTVQHIATHDRLAAAACGSLASATPGAPVDGGQRLHLYRVSPAPSTRRRGTTGGFPPLLFSGFRPITNRGQQ